ncbi:MAG: hypothetical protein B7Z08_01605 [Sphingomonadales bacterium 32-68-7]|nr:MAG: hypothetical protein B7Z33_00445 [Sphingomonadales bacterium 12-68-11]OYX10275.1 MAG: hypothetical protein B7Z08_01605 [Sphingomonadales bacterium 32-68-7]
MSDPLLPVTALYAAPLALLFLVLCVRVIVVRRRKMIGFGFADDPDLERRIRVQANFAEYAPFALLLIALAELNGAAPLWLHVAGAMLLAGRVIHAVGVSRPGSDGIGRVLGMTGSQTAILIAAALLVV